MPINLDTDLLRAFVTVADTRSFTRAADALFRTQAAVSQQVKRLEEAVGARVFDRDPRGVRLTAEGERLLAYARRLLLLNDEAVASLRGPADVPAVRVGAPDDYATLLLPRALARFAAEHPGVPVEVVCDNSVDLGDAVERGQYDLALVTRYPGMTGGRTLRREPLLWVAGGGEGDGPERGDPLPLAVFAEGCVCRLLAAEALERAGRCWRAAFVSDSVVAIHGAVLAGLAVTVLEACTVPPGLRVLGPEAGLPDLPPVDIALFQAPGPPSPAVRGLADALVAALGT